MNKREARRLGTAHGYNAATWAFNGNSPTDLYRRVLKMYDDGDPEVYDMVPAWLSREWAGESMEELGMADATDEQCQMYKEAADEAFWKEVIRVCQYHLHDDEIDRLIG